MRIQSAMLRMLMTAFAALMLLNPGVQASDKGFPADFTAPREVLGGAGGGVSRAERSRMTHLPVIMIADNARDFSDWTGANPGNGRENVYQAFLARDFQPIELWMLNLTAKPGEQLSDLELRTDNLKALLFAVLKYTGAPQAVLLGHGAGAVLAQAALIKYNLFPLVPAAAYIAGPFHGTYACSFDKCFDGLPLCCNLTPGSDFLQDVLIPEETPFNADKKGGAPALTRYLTVRNGRRFGDAWFQRNPESPALNGARNLVFPAFDHDGLRTARETLDQVIPFLTAPGRPCTPDQDRDGDGFCGKESGGPDCDDGDPAIFPGAEERCDDGIDQDCSGYDLSCSAGKDRDVAPDRLPGRKRD